MKKFLSILAAATVLFAGCEDEKEQTSASYVKLSGVEYAAGPEGGNFEITVESNDIWEVSGRSDWARPLSDSGKNGDILTFEIDPNESRDAKTATFKVFSGSAVQAVTITSNPGFTMELKSEPKVILSSDATEVRVELDTNIPDIVSEFSGSGAEWIKYESRQEVFGKTILKYSISANEKYVGRESELTLSGNSRSIAVSISQAQLDAIITDTPKVVYTGLNAGEVTFNVRANVDFTFALPSWLTLVSQIKGAQDSEGLTASTITLSFGESSASRVADLSFVYNGNSFLLVSVKQQNPNAVLFNISDAVLRQELVKNGWILASDASAECELLEPGQTGTALDISSSGYYALDIKTIDGLGNFPNLETLVLNKVNVSRLDLSDCKKLTSLTTTQTNKLAEVILGSCPVTSFSTYVSGMYASSYFDSGSLTISSDNLTSINVNCESYYMSYYEKLEYVDVSACPELTELKAKRFYSGWGGNSFLKELRISSAQKAAIDAGTLAMEVYEGTDVTVK